MVTNNSRAFQERRRRKKALYPKDMVRWSEEEDQLLRELSAAGWMAKDISDRMGRTPSTIAVRKQQLGCTGHVATCKQCGGPMEQSPRGRPKWYCSDDCRKSAMKEKRARAYQEKWDAKDWTCAHCGGPLPKTSLARMYCTKECNESAWYLRKLMRKAEGL